MLWLKCDGVPLFYENGLDDLVLDFRDDIGPINGIGVSENPLLLHVYLIG
jgi:hypothetical protein